MRKNDFNTLSKTKESYEKIKNLRKEINTMDKKLKISRGDVFQTSQILNETSKRRKKIVELLKKLDDVWCNLN